MQPQRSSESRNAPITNSHQNALMPPLKNGWYKMSVRGWTVATNIEVRLYLDEPYAQLHQSLNVFKGCLVKHGLNVFHS